MTEETQVPGAAPEADEPAKDPLGFDFSLSFPQILHQLGISLLVTTYQAGRVYTVTSNGEDIKLVGRNYTRAMGCYVYPRGLLLATQNQILSFTRAPQLIPRYFPDQNYDNLYLTQYAHYTGDIAAHDVVMMDGKVVVVSSTFNCLVTMSPDHSFIPLWKPHFISALVAEDRCHLNGVALVAGRPRYVTCLGTTDKAGAWRENKATGGVVMDINTNQVICEGLAMPHSPRCYEGDLWVLSSGTGELGIVNSLGFQSMITLPGFLRGLAFAGPYAFVGLSKIREKKTFGGLPVEEKIKDLRCSVEVVNLKTGLWEGALRFQGDVEELYDVQVIPQCRLPLITGYDQVEDRQFFFNLPVPTTRR
ncbi:TIGR03032 family protein [Candidatus Cyanaurora vandensis]|uniref:TIGR03032 family protein n=1 Tax=Candidatus Cyanaurora vandensis TaxID=2714958 RepID=UPI00257E5CEB|nr:TIGR03032 family protein [Candidatus Cyanaurora vandensis]